MRVIGTIDERLALIAGRAHGVDDAGRAVAVTPSHDQIDRRVAAGSLLTEYPGTYFVGDRPPTATAKATWPPSRRAGSWALRAERPWHGCGTVRASALPAEVTAPGEHRIRGLHTCRRRRMDLTDGTRRHGIAITSVPATLIAVSSLLPFDEPPQGRPRGGCQDTGSRAHTSTRWSATRMRRTVPQMPAIATERCPEIVLSRLESISSGCSGDTTSPGLRRTGRTKRATRLPLAGPSTSWSTRLLPFTDLPRLGEGPTAELRPRAWRRVPPLHLARRRRGPRPNRH